MSSTTPNGEDDVFIRRSTRSKRKREEWSQTLEFRMRTSRASGVNDKIEVSSIGGQPSHHKKQTDSASADENGDTTALRPFCGQCGLKHTASNRFCVKCGTERSRIVMDPPPMDPPPSPESDDGDGEVCTSNIIVLVIVCVLCHILILYLRRLY